MTLEVQSAVNSLSNALEAILAIDAGLWARYTETDIEKFLEAFLPGSQWNSNEQLAALFEYCTGHTPDWMRTSLAKKYWTVHEMFGLEICLLYSSADGAPLHLQLHLLDSGTVMCLLVHDTDQDNRDPIFYVQDNLNTETRSSWSGRHHYTVQDMSTLDSSPNPLPLVSSAPKDVRAIWKGIERNSIAKVRIIQDYRTPAQPSRQQSISGLLYMLERTGCHMTPPLATVYLLPTNLNSIPHIKSTRTVMSRDPFETKIDKFDVSKITEDFEMLVIGQRNFVVHSELARDICAVNRLHPKKKIGRYDPQYTASLGLAHFSKPLRDCKTTISLC
ncbi:hypothetical protein HD553DRAFT_327295 [Filobasidium floriforme]|uniref:uncharacterized protein n=1 Tax=Filobasidium floriforme TaxID=5210 RepID=UPI001E8D2106|nr:uncharacterized protein HD553DRAFT_327295 [Filobasidium floriforme]KAH8077476.1 hypothetical protein HD553DRAFT_327295 [Filobasidium floriforme]